MLDRTSALGDQEFDARYTRLPDIIHSWLRKYIALESSDVLDFGCGEGITALGMARRFNTRLVRGVDIMPDPSQCLSRAREVLGLDALPGNLSLHQIQPGATFDAPGSFDLIYSWSAFEHVAQPLISKVLQQLKTMLRPGGYLFIQIAPLYYSAEGSHLYHKIKEPWGHLLNQGDIYFDKLSKACVDKDEVDALWSTYQTLNRLTVPELKERLSDHNFKIVREYTTKDPSDRSVPAGLSRIFDKEILRVNQVVLLCRSTKSKRFFSIGR